MAGKTQHPAKNNDFKDPFNAGQMVGMMMVLSFVEKNGGITTEIIDKIKETCATNLQVFFDKPTEDIHLMVNNMVKDIEQL